jgi:hemolysin type calcium-binding protein
MDSGCTQEGAPLQALRLRRFGTIVVLAVAGSLAFAEASEASNVVYTLDTPHSRVDINGDADADLVSLSLTATSLRIVDTGPSGISTMAPCTLVNTTTVDCPLVPVAPNGPLGQINATLGAGADTLAATDVPNFLLVSGDGGADTIVSTGASDDSFGGGMGNDTLAGGDGDDFLDGDQDEDSVDGGAGDDEVDGSLGSDSLNGGAGADVLRDGGAAVPGEPATGSDSLDGGPGEDSITYQRDAGLSLSLDGVANDGEPGEGDNLVGIETINGGDGDDTITGDATQNLLSGGDGNDTLSGLGGGDGLSGDDGDDSLIGADGADVLNCGLGFDTALVDPEDDVDPLCDRIGANLSADTVNVNRKGAGKVTVSCRAEEGVPCVGTLTILASGKTLGTGKFSATQGTSVKGQFKLSKKGLKKLKKSGGSLFATVEARTTEPAGVSLATQQVLLEGKSKKPKKGGGKKGGKGGKGPKA